MHKLDVSSCQSAEINFSWAKDVAQSTLLNNNLSRNTPSSSSKRLVENVSDERHSA